MRIQMRLTFRLMALGFAFVICAIAPASAQDTKDKYPAMAPLSQYLMPKPSDEIALARSAAPPSVSADADVLTLSTHGYETAVKGKNGFVCLVERGWAASFEDAVFWNPKNRSPICLNPAAVRSILPAYIERTEWVVAGVPKSVMIERTKAELAAKKYVLPEAGAMSYMMSKQGYLNDAAGHWHPHVMFWVANTDEAAWGANLDASPVFAAKMDPENITIYFVPVAKWSDGTPDKGKH
jgi:hypothetical protein